MDKPPLSHAMPLPPAEFTCRADARTRTPVPLTAVDVTPSPLTPTTAPPVTATLPNPPYMAAYVACWSMCNIPGPRMRTPAYPLTALTLRVQTMPVWIPESRISRPVSVESEPYSIPPVTTTVQWSPLSITEPVNPVPERDLSVPFAVKVFSSLPLLSLTTNL